MSRHQLADDGGLLPLTDAEGWLVTKDRGEIRDGHLYFLGRLDDQINVSGVKLSAEHLERHVLTGLPQLAGRFAITGIDDPMRGQLPLAALEAGAQDMLPALQQAMTGAMAFHGVSGGEVFRTTVVAALPVTGSGKIQRARLRDLYQAEASVPVPVAGRKRRVASVRDIYHHHFPQADLTPETTFETLGGDSLNFLSVALDLERLLGEIPEGWERIPLAQLERVAPSRSFFSRIDTATVMRALSITLIIAGHFNLLQNVGGGALVLFFIAGMSFGALTLPKVVQSGRVAAILVLVLRIAFLTWLWMSLNLLLTGYGSGLAYLFLTNWVAPDYPGGVWFVGVYIQIALCLAVLLSFAGPRRAVAQNAFAASVGLTCIMIAVMALSEMAVNTDHLYRRLPHLMAWFFTCGIAAHYADTVLRKLLVAGLFLLGWLIFAGPGISFVVLAVPIMLAVPYIRLPQPVIPVIRMVAAASLLLYLSHFQFLRVTEILGIASPLVSTVVAIIGGTLAYMLYRPIDDWLRKRLVRVFG